MVCDRCVGVLTKELQKEGFSVVNAKLGEIEIANQIGKEALEQIRNILKINGFELVEDRKQKIVEQIKTLVIELIHRNLEATPLLVNYSDYFSEQLGFDYSYLSMLFSSHEGITIEKYIILQKIERVKELLTYGELTLSEIAYQMDYSSVQHLSNQFKKVTGLTPSEYKQQKDKARRGLDKVGT
ncbi:AraC-type DNA-binding protein [Thermoflexibacter ruber]|uniref:AraC-type DNA-binding protein n=2 Tax=Thermoflexibacter ruber TaxID=1003 RepID=A0A1I2CR68_9BACT|nr:AraC-type DNA-binding protein [Thermoflexibacter ruber]